MRGSLGLLSEYKLKIRVHAPTGVIHVRAYLDNALTWLKPKFHALLAACARLEDAVSIVVVEPKSGHEVRLEVEKDLNPSDLYSWRKLGLL